MKNDGWIKFRYKLPTSANVAALADLCDCKENEALGALARFWVTVAQLPDYDTDTDKAFFAKGVTAKAIDRIAALSGFSNALLSLRTDKHRWLDFDDASGRFFVPEVKQWIGSERKRAEELQSDADRKRGRKSDGGPPEIRRSSGGNPTEIHHSPSISISDSHSSVSGSGAGETVPVPGSTVASMNLHEPVWAAWTKNGVLPATDKRPAAIQIGYAIGLVALRPPHCEKQGRAALESAAAWLAGRVDRWRESPLVKSKSLGSNKHAAGWFEAGRYDDDDSAWNRTDDRNERGAKPTAAQCADAGKFTHDRGRAAGFVED